MGSIIKKIKEFFKEIINLLIYRIVMLVWFSRWRKKIFLPFFHSRFFIFLFLDRLSPAYRKDSKKPTLSQTLFQKVLIGTIRHPGLLLLRTLLRVCVTYRCNLTCHACYAERLREYIKQDMKLEDFHRLILWAKDKGWERIRFLGGEPTIHPQFIEMLDICYRNKMSVSIPTNNFFSKEILEKLDNPLVNHIDINYNAGMDVKEEKRALFRENLAHLYKRGMPFSFAYILDYKEDNTEIYEDIRRYKPLYVRVSLKLPSFNDQSDGQSGFFDLSNIDKSLFMRLFNMLENCVKLSTPFYIYRPLHSCLLSKGQQEKIMKYSRHIFYSRCPMSYQGKQSYDALVTVNPDLSMFPCASVFIQGPNIFSFKTQDEVYNFYKGPIKSLLLRPFMEACKNCEYHKRFIDAIKKDISPEAPIFDDKEICQGGCLNFRCNKIYQSECFSE